MGRMIIKTPTRLIRAALPEVSALMVEAFEVVGGEPTPGSALDQAGLADGAEDVEDWLSHGEPGLALEHLVYMIREPRLPISDATYLLIAKAGQQLNMDPVLWEDLRPDR